MGRSLLFGLLTSLPLLKAQGKGNDCPHKKSATLLPSFTVTPTATESTASTGTTSYRTTTGTIRPEPTTATHNPVTTTSHGNATVHPTSNSTATSPGSSTSSPHPRPPPPSPSPTPGSKADVGDYTGTNGSQPCVHLQAEIRIRILYLTQGGGKVKLKDGGEHEWKEPSAMVLKGRKNRKRDKCRVRMKGTRYLGWHSCVAL